MSNSVKNSQNNTQKNSEEKPRRPRFFERLITLKGTAEEPWPTAEELWDAPGVKEAIKAHAKEYEKVKKAIEAHQSKK